MMSKYETIVCASILYLQKIIYVHVKFFWSLMNLVILYMYESAAFFTDKSYMLRKIVASFII